MLRDKRGLSTVVTTLIIILLVLVAIGIIWVVIRGVIDTGAGSIDYSVKCLDTVVQPTAVTYSVGSGNVNLTFERDPKGDDMGGVKLVFKNSTTGESTGVLDLPMNLPPFETNRTYNFPVGTTFIPDRLESTVYLLDESGTPQICSDTRDFNNIQYTA